MKTKSRLMSKCSSLFLNYSSFREIEIRNTSVGIIYRILQLIVLSYIFLYIVWIRKGYQIVEGPRGTSVIKIKGVAKPSIGNIKMYQTDDQPNLIWDASEFGIPPLEVNAFFIATRKTITFDQTQGICSSALTEKLYCNTNQYHCEQGRVTNDTFGFLTGRCISSFENSAKNVCEINAWCPEELSNSTDDQIDVDDLKNFTVFIKTMVSFSGSKIKLRTVKDDTNFTCRYDSVTARYCPIFRIGFILDTLYQQDRTINLSALYYFGGLIEIEQNWQCNFDFEEDRKECFPNYSFNVLQRGDDKLSPGINYRFADKYRLNGKEYRTLTKMYGLRFVLAITGSGGRFDLYYLFLSVGSGISCLMIADVICEFIFLYIHKKKNLFRRHKVTNCHLIENEIKIEPKKF